MKINPITPNLMQTRKTSYKNVQSFRGLKFKNPQAKQDILYISGFLGLMAVPTVLCLLAEKYFNRSDEHKNDIFLSDGTYLGTAEDLFGEDKTET